MNPVRKSLMIVAGIAIGACATEPKSPGVLWLSYSTKIGDEQPFSWKLAFDDRTPLIVSSATTASTKFDSLSAGAHRMVVSDLPAQCSTGNDDRSIDIPGGDTLHLSFQVTCTRVTGDVAITVSTNGPDRDLDGYILLVDGQPLMALPPLNSVTRTIAKLKPGTHLFALSGVASNCSVTNGATSAFVTAGKSVLTLLTVNCVANSGNLRITTTTSGGPALADPSGYIVETGTVTARIASNAVTPISVPAGSYTVVLSDIEPNCTAAATQKAATVAVGVTTEIGFDITCDAYAPTTAALSATDPVLDTLPNQENSSSQSFDIIGLTTSYASNFMTIALRFNRAIGSEVVVGYLDFDLDEDVETGFDPFMNVFGGTASQGVDGFLSFSTGSAPIAAVSTPENFGLVRITVDGDSVRFIIPLERFDDGNLTITAIIGSSDRPTDWIPNADVLVSHLPASPVAMQRRVMRSTPRVMSTQRIQVFPSSATWARSRPPR